MDLGIDSLPGIATERLYAVHTRDYLGEPVEAHREMCADIIAKDFTLVLP